MAAHASSERQSPFPVVAALIAISALFGLFIMPRIAPAGGDAINKPAPDFALPVVANGDAGAMMRLSDLKDKVIILDFWASWCGPCAVQAPIVDRVAHRHPDDVVVLGINVGESPAKAAAYAKRKGLSYPILADPEGTAQALYGANTLPTIAVIGPNGNIQSLVHGVVRESTLERAIRNLQP